MKLYFSPGACSLSPHIALLEAGIAFDKEQVDLKAKKTKSGNDFTAINPKGQVPTLQLDNGDILTEGPAIVQYIADQKPAANPEEARERAGAKPKGDEARRVLAREFDFARAVVWARAQHEQADDDHQHGK